jgi:hypothetical protein
MSDRTFFLWSEDDALIAVVVGIEALELLAPRWPAWTRTSWI